MSDVTFYFIRHGYSCSNLNRKKTNKMTWLAGDSHLTNWGIISSIFAGEYLKNTFFNDISFDHMYCSPLIRTWETAACMFSDKYKEFIVAPHLAEIRNDNKKSYQYDINQKRYKEFVRFVTSDSDTSINYIIDNLDNNDIIRKQIDNIKDFKILYKGKKYPKKYIETCDSGIENFINWFLKQNKTSKKQNVLIICHNKIMINFLDNYYQYTYYKQNILKTNNFSFKVHVKNGIISHPTVYFLGIKNPIGHEDSIDIECSLCVTHKKCNKKDKKIHLKLIKNKEKYLF
jgi:hypothetical protein